MLEDRPNIATSLKTIKLSLHISARSGLTGIFFQGYIFDRLRGFFNDVAQYLNLKQLILRFQGSDFAIKQMFIVLGISKTLDCLEPLCSIKTLEPTIEVVLWKYYQIGNNSKEPYYSEIAPWNRSKYPEEMTEDQVNNWNEEVAQRRSAQEKKYKTQLEAIFLPPKATPPSEMQLYVAQHLE